jgi:flagellar protein FlaG
MLLQKIDGVAPSVAQASEGIVASTPQRPLVHEASSVPPETAATNAAADAVRAAVADANRNIQSFTNALQFEVDPDTRKIVVRLVDTQDNRVLRQVPSQEMMAIARALERMQTLLVRAKA